jgi:hypothetical protein
MCIFLCQREYLATGPVHYSYSNIDMGLHVQSAVSFTVLYSYLIRLYILTVSGYKVSLVHYSSCIRQNYLLLYSTWVAGRAKRYRICTVVAVARTVQ